MQRATPPAPDLSRTAGEWSDGQLFWIIRHGVKYTGMPAWGTPDRPDEVRRMVAFVRRLPTMTAAQYRSLTDASATPAPLPGLRLGTLAACTGCHGGDGRGRGQGDIPVLGGQSPVYLLATMRDFASGRRKSAVMQAAVAALTDAEMGQLARHFAAMPGLDTAVLPSLRIDAAPGRPVPDCATCHAPGKAAPRLQGQKATYIAARLHGWQGEGEDVDARRSPATMAVIARRIPPDQVAAIARMLEGPRAPR
jgi:cytochrome c553